MKTYRHLEPEIEQHPESWFCFPQSFLVPRGCLYRTDTDSKYRYAAHEVTIDLSCAGDWLEIINEEETRLVRHVIY